jgi:WD40 repeat protein
VKKKSDKEYSIITYGLQNVALATPSSVILQICNELYSENICPYQGLSAFTEANAKFFCGRDILVEEIIEKLRQSPQFLSIAGRSGSGKSSVIQAKILPRLQADGIISSDNKISIVQARLSDKSTAEESLFGALKGLNNFIDIDNNIWMSMQAYLHDRKDRIIVFIDQFEELFTTFSTTENEIFISELSKLLDASPCLTLLIAIRIEFESYLESSSLRNWWDKGLFRVRGIPGEHLEIDKVITEPAEKVGLIVEAGLVDNIINDLGKTTSPLPLLEFALTTLWDNDVFKGGQNMLTYKTYRSLSFGKVVDLLRHEANEVYEYELAFNAVAREWRRKSPRIDEQKELVLSIFGQLIQFGINEVPDTRCRKRRADLEKVDSRLLDQMLGTRLLVMTEDSNEFIVEIVHDVLIPEWLAKIDNGRWLEKQRQFRLWQQRLEEDIQNWENKNCDKLALLSDDRLLTAERYFNSHQINLVGSQQEYIQKSVEERDRQETQRNQIANREKIYKRKIVGSITIALIFLLALVVYHFRSDFQEQTNKSLRLANASETNLNIDPTKSFWLAIAAVFSHRTPQAELALWNAVQANHERVQLVGHESEVRHAEFAPGDSQLVLTVSRDRTARIWNLNNPSHPLILKGHEDVITHGSFDPNNYKRVLTVSYDETARIWNLDNPSNPIILKGHKGLINSGTFDPKNSNRVLTVSNDGTARIWDVNNPNNSLILKGHNDNVLSGSFDPQDSNRVLTVSSDGTARIWNLKQTDKPVILKGHTNQVIYGGFDPKNSKRVLTASHDGTARIWNLDKPDQSIVLKGHSKAVKYAAFDKKDSNRILTVSSDGTARIWNIQNPQQSQILRGHTDEIIYGEFDPKDSNRLLTVSYDGTARIWDLRTSSTIYIFRGHTGQVIYGTFDPKDSNQLLTVSKDKTARIWNIQNSSSKQIPNQKNVNKYSVISSNFANNNSNELLTVGADGFVRDWDFNNVEEFKTLPIKLGSIQKAWLAPSDPNIIATINANKEFILWHIQHPDNPLPLAKGEEEILDVRFDPKNSKRILRINTNNTVTILDISNEQSIQLPSLRKVTEAEFDINNSYRVATASIDGIVHIWDLKQIDRPLKPILTLKTDQKKIWRISFDPYDSNRILLMSDDGVARVWNLDSNSIVVELSGHQQAIVDGSFDPNNINRILTISKDGTARVWNLAMPNNPLIVNVGRNLIAGNFDLQDSNRFRVLDSDGITHVYYIGGNNIIKSVWSSYSRCLNEKEVSDYKINKIELEDKLLKISERNESEAKQDFRPNCQKKLTQNE